jgi:hypothetical protein
MMLTVSCPHAQFWIPAYIIGCPDSLSRYVISNELRFCTLRYFNIYGMNSRFVAPDRTLYTLRSSFL